MDHETTITKAMNTGQHAFTVMFNYNLAALNNAATSPLAGQFALALMPGETHECYGFAKFYNMTQMAVDRGPEVVDAVGKFISLLRRRGRRQLPGGQALGRRAGARVRPDSRCSTTPRSSRPSRSGSTCRSGASSSSWRGRAGRRSGTASGARPFHPLLGQALAGEITADECLQQSADVWNELKASVEG